MTDHSLGTRERRWEEANVDNNIADSHQYPPTYARAGLGLEPGTMSASVHHYVSKNAPLIIRLGFVV